MRACRAHRRLGRGRPSTGGGSALDVNWRRLPLRRQAQEPALLVGLAGWCTRPGRAQSGGDRQASRKPEIRCAALRRIYLHAGIVGRRRGGALTRPSLLRARPLELLGAVGAAPRLIYRRATALVGRSPSSRSAPCVDVWHGTPSAGRTPMATARRERSRRQRSALHLSGGRARGLLWCWSVGARASSTPCWSLAKHPGTSRCALTALPCWRSAPPSGRSSGGGCSAPPERCMPR